MLYNEGIEFKAYHEEAMPRFSVLASGSSGNAAFVQLEGFGLLIDIGLGPRLISSRLAAIGMSWRDVNAVLLTHVHTDHWKDRTLAQLCTQRIPLYCHSEHVECMRWSESFEPLRSAGLVRHFEADSPWKIADGLQCRALPVPHDSPPTFAFRLDGGPGLFHGEWSLGYAADLGVVPSNIVEAFRDVQVVALEFNHDVDLQRRSGRSASLIARVLGEQGHLSNRQAAEALSAILERSQPGSVRHVVQLHLSQQCNRPALAQEAARQVLQSACSAIELHTACHDRPTRLIDLGNLVEV